MTADKSGLLSGIKIAIAILTACMVGGTAIAQSFSRPADLAFNREDLDFVLKQIKISERHAAGELLPDILPNISIPWGLRTVDGRYNNLFPGREGFGQADREFNQTAERDFREASELTLDPDNGGPQMVGDKTSYGMNTNVEDSTPRLISHLVVNQSTENPAAVHAAAEEDGVNVGPDIAGTDQFFIPNVATDEGLSAPFNTFLTFFGQFFDHGLDLVNKGGSGNVFMRVPADDPLFDDTNADMNFMIMPRASRDAGPDGIIDTMDDVSFPINATTPHVDQQQTYASHASSQIILRHYEMGMGGGGALSVANIGDWMDGDLPGYDHAAPAGSNRVLVVMAHAEDNSPPGDVTDFTSVSYGGQALTQVVEQLQHQTTAGGFSAIAEIWILNEAGLQAAAGSTLVATTTGGNGGVEAKRISSLFFSGVDQADPTGQTGTDGENANNTQTLSVTVTGGELDAGDMVLANNTVRNDTNGDTSFAWANGFTPTGEYSPTPNSVGAFLTYSDAQTLANGGLETATVEIMNNGVGALSVVVLNHAGGIAVAELQSSGRLLNWYGNDGILDNADDGGMATWDTAQAQALLKMGIILDDNDGNNVPMFASDEYGNFTPGPNGLPQLVLDTNDPPTLLEGNLATPVDASLALRVNQSFFLDVAHSANPNGKTPDPDTTLNPRTDMLSGQFTRGIRANGPPGTYDDELLGRHFICGDGRCNENIALSTVHTIFHAEHNRLSAQTQRVVLDSGDLDFLNEWLDMDVPAFPAWGGLPFDVSNASLANQAATIAAIDALNLDWDGSRLFQSARFGTEMQYNRVVFDEFVPTLAGLKDPFDGFHIDVDPSITFEFSQSVYRFGHSMLTETVERRDPDYNPITETHTGSNEQLGLFEAFLNPLALYNAGEDGVATLTPEQGTGAVIRGLTRAGGNEIDEFVTGGMQNNVVGLPLDLGAINIARGRDVGNPRLNDARRTFFEASGDPRVLPYEDWLDYADNLRHELTLINLIAAYGTHTAVAGDDGQVGTYDANEPDTYASRRAAACGIVSSLVPDLAARATYCTGHGFAMVQPAVPADALDFLLSRGTWATGADGRATTGLEDIDFWVGGLAEERMPFGGLLGSTHNFVFEVQAEALQNGDRFYYVGRTKGTGLNFFSELESNSFTALIMRNTDLGEVGGSTLPINIFATQNHYLEVDQTEQWNEGYGGVNDSADPEPETELLPLIIRDADMVTMRIFIPDATRIVQYTGGDHVTIGGTEGDDTMIGGIGDDTFWGGAGNDRIEGGDGADSIEGGPGDDIISDLSGPDVIEGGAGHDAIFSGNEEDIVFGDAGNDFIVNSSEFLEGFGGEGDDWFLDGVHISKIIAGAGDDWIEELGGGENIHALDNSKAAESGEPPTRGNDIFIAYAGNNDMDMEHGDDIMVDGPGIDRMEGQLGFDWASFQNDTEGVLVDLDLTIFVRPVMPPSNASIGNRYDRVEGLSGSPLGDILRGTPNRPGIDRGSELVNIGLTAIIDGINDLVPESERFDLEPDVQTGDPQFGWTGGELIIGGGGSDILVGEGGDDILDGDVALQVGINTPNPELLNGAAGQALAMAQEALASAQQAQADLQTAVAGSQPQADADAAAAAPAVAQAAAAQANADAATAAATLAISNVIALQNTAAAAGAQAIADAAAVALADAQAAVAAAAVADAMATATTDAAASGVAAAAAAAAQAASDTAAATAATAQAAADDAADDASESTDDAVAAVLELVMGNITMAEFDAAIMKATDDSMASGAAATVAATASAAANTAAATAATTATVAAIAATNADNSEAAAIAAGALAASTAAEATVAAATAATNAAEATAAAAAVGAAQATSVAAAQFAVTTQATADAAAATAAGLQAAADASAAMVQILADGLPGAAQVVAEKAGGVAAAQAAIAAIPAIVVVDGMRDVMGAVFAGLINPGELSKSRIISDHDPMNVSTDSALFSGNVEDYTIEAEMNGFLVVTDTRPILANLRPNHLGSDGRDLVRNVERLVFTGCSPEPCDSVVQLAEGIAGSAGLNNAVAEGQPTITGSAQVGQTLMVSTAGVTDADNTSSMGAVNSPVGWTWEAELLPGSNFFTPIVRLLGFAGNGDPFTANGDELLLTAEEAGLQVRAQGIFQDEAGVFEIVTSAPVLVGGPNGAVALTTFAGTTDFINTAAITFENLAFSGGTPRMGFGVSISRMDLVLFINTGFQTPPSAKDVATVSNIQLTFTNIADGVVTGVFTPTISASIRPFPMRIEPNKVNLDFEILGDAILPLVKGPTLASVSLNGEEIANATYDGDSSVDFGRGVIITLVNGVPNPEFAVDGGGLPGGDGLPRQCQGCSEIGEGDDEGDAAPADDGAAPADGAADGAGGAGEDGVDVPTDTVASSASVDRRGRIRIRGVCDSGRASAPGLTCETTSNGDFDCRGRDLDRGLRIEATCGNGSGASTGTGVAPAVTITGTADSRGSLRISGVCENFGEASAPELRCSTRRSGSFRCSGRGLNPGQIVSVNCN